MSMNAQTTLIIATSMHSVQTLLVHLTVNVKLGFLEMEFPVQVIQINFITIYNSFLL